MRIATILSISLAAALVLAACGAPAGTPASTGNAAPPASPAASGNASSASGTQVDVTLADNTIDSSLTAFQVGVPYTFVITNSGHHAHNFNIAPPADVAGGLDAALQQALLSVDQSKLPVGAQVTVDYTFPASAAGADLELSCLIPRHYEDGMRLGITVTK
jgi:uncharacterized cupredoxin-like copper-binding protein